MQLIGLAFQRMFGLFAGVSVSLELKIRVWNAQSVLLYGCGTWGLNATMAEKLCALHRRHLCIMHPSRLSLAKVHTQCIVQTDKVQISLNRHKRSRLSLLGHCLRMPTDTPAQLALSATVNTNLKGRRGRPPKAH